MDYRRVKRILEKKISGPILYWMSRDQRIRDNWALIYAQELALNHKQPIIVVFCLQQEFLGAEPRIFDFMLDGLEIIEKDCIELNITFVALKGDPRTVLTNFIEEYKIGMLITDFSPLKIKRNWIESLRSKLNVSFSEVDTHNIVPCWIASNKKEYAAYTIRSKISKLLAEFLVEFPEIKKHPYSWKENFSEVNWVKLRNFVSEDNPKYTFDWIRPGEDQARGVLKLFVEKKLRNYTRERNDPNLNSVSDLSPYLHFGQISSQRVVLEATKTKRIINLKGSFYDEIIVRKELSDNFCFYSPDYDTTASFQSWAIETLNQHLKDKRDYKYTLEELERARTHDDLWNTAQRQMIKRGKMHGYLRMYWAKKILEWTETPEKAVEYAIYLNDKYELDGRDPNGYAGIAWSIGGVHDRAWGERKVFGKIRYMSYDGMKRKFNIKQYIDLI
ncbi:MAG: deoxyribodipyrimidine photo-lyase [Candidatus Lokiarchaeota archaeon]|nr:deoxyribodipyrimidine photo-lyase [Candidatus Lokiarchaeota archaeon]